MKNYIQPGATLTLVLPYDRTAGQAFKVGAFIAVAATTGVTGQSVEGSITGLFELTSDTGAAWSQGDVAYWDDTNKRFTKTTSGNTKAGIITEAKASGDVLGRIRLVPTI
jgi:predicted RecA/RadA family phage recombinase